MSLSPYQLDVDGYVVVEFLDKNGKVLSTPAFYKSKSMVTGSEPSIEDAVDNPYIIAARSNKITETMLRDIDYTTILRLAYLFPSVGLLVTKLYGIRGVPLRWGVFPNGVPLLEPYKLDDHQIKALGWMKEREKLTGDPKAFGVRGGILSLTMGLGKTLTALILCLSSAKGRFPTLIIASKTVMYEWKASGAEKFFSRNVKVMYMHKDYMGKNVLTISRREIMEYDIVVTSYDFICSAGRSTKYHTEGFEMGDDHSLMKGKIFAIHLRSEKQADKPKVTGPGIVFCTPWERVICDESQRFVNPDTATYKCIMGVYGKYKWCLSGSPIKNYDTDIWAQLRFCGYTGVIRALDWKRAGKNKMTEHKLREAVFSMNYVDANIILPPKLEHTIFIELQGREKEVYNYMLGKTRDAFDQMMKKLCSFACVLALFTRLRQCAISPYLITAESKREKSSGAKSKADKQALEMIAKMGVGEGSLGMWVHNKRLSGMMSTKITMTMDRIKKIPNDEKVLVFSMFVSALDILADACREFLPGFEFLQIDGDVVGGERANIIDQFKCDPSIRGLFLTYKVGGEGLNLTEATHCIPLEPWWSPSVCDQAKHRCWRRGQTRPVHVHNIVTKNTIEERVLAIAKQKKGDG